MKKIYIFIAIGAILALIAGLFLFLNSGYSEPYKESASNKGDVDSDSYRDPLADSSTDSVKRGNLGEFPQKLHVAGNSIVDESSNLAVLRGVNVLDPLAQATWGEEAMGEWGENYYKKAKEFGAQIIRVPIHPEVWRDTEERFKILDKTIEWIGDSGMYVILDYHSIGFLPDDKYEESVHKTSISEMKRVWGDIAKRYKGNNVVAFYDIFNEPTNLRRDASEYNAVESSSDWERWKTNVEEIVDAIRENNDSAVVLVGGLNWSYDLTNVLNNPVNRENIVYSIHPYPGKSDYLSWGEAFGKVAERYPIFAGELGFWSEQEIRELTAGRDTDSDTWNPVYIEASYTEGSYRDDIVKYLEDRNIGWTVWSFSPTWGPAMLKNWDYAPTQSGVFFGSIMQQNSN